MLTQNWCEALRKTLGLRVEQLERLSDVLDDPTCWFVGAEFAGSAVINLPVAEQAATTAYLLRLPAGTAIPVHCHEARERVLILRGGLTSAGVHYRPGELIDNAIGSEHTVQVDASEDCICAIRLDFTGRPKQTALDKGTRFSAPAASAS